MPNHVRNYIRFVSEDKRAIQQMLESVLSSENNEVFFDFNHLVNMPESLNISEGTSTDVGQTFYKLYQSYTTLPESEAERILNAKECGEVFRRGDIEQVTNEYRKYMKRYHPDVCQDSNATQITQKLNHLFEQAKYYLQANIWRGSLTGFDRKALMSERSWDIDYLNRELKQAGLDPNTPESIITFRETQRGKEMYELGKTACLNEQLYGARSWYDWCCKNWGTKWNSYDNEIDRENAQIRFCTAWSAPFPIAEAMTVKFPDIGFDWLYADEDMGYNTGRFLFENGKFTVKMFEHCSDEAMKTYETCWAA